MFYGIIGFCGKMGREIISVFEGADHKCTFKKDLHQMEAGWNPEVIIDFSLPSAIDITIKEVSERGSKLVTGVTGYSEEDLAKIKQLAEKTTVIQSNNFSIGLQMVLRSVTKLSENLPNWDIEISETHHRFKKDKPSGTAIMLKDAIGKPVNISSLRLGNVVGDHTVSFGALTEVITISHRALSRRAFAEGALKAAEFALTAETGYYSFADVLFGKGK